MDELERFRKKAKYYRQALTDCPNARLLELYPIISYLERHRSSIGKRRARLRVVDLMSGSGFLSDKLQQLGYTDIHAVECCKEMYDDAMAYRSRVQLHSLSSFDHLAGLLDELKADVIVSLASFHHLIVYQTDGAVDRARSTQLQADVIDDCMRALPDNGILIVADLVEDSTTETALEPFTGSLRNVAALLRRLGLDESVARLLSSSTSLHGASSRIHRELGGSAGNVSLKWFRGVVEKKTDVGHKDVALSGELMEKLSSYRPVVTKYVCPWVFDDIGSLSEFVYNKFAFVLGSAVSKEDASALAKEHLGQRGFGEVLALNWNLGVVLLGKLEPFSADKARTLEISALLAAAFVLVVGLILRLVADIYLEITPKDLLLFFFTLPLGILVGEFIRRR